MPMNPRLLRPRQTGGDPDALRYIAAVQAADGQPLEAGVRKAINDFVIGCKADGIWSAIKASCILAGARTLSGALTPLTGAAPTNANFVSIDYNRKTGLVGDGSTKRIDTNRASNADGQDDMHVAVYVSTIQSGALQRHYVGDGSFAGASGQTAIVSNSAGLIMRSRSSTAQSAIGRNVAGLIGISRSSSSQYLLRGNNVESTLSQTSSTPPAGNFSVFSISATSGTFTDARIAYYSIGSALSLSTLQTRVDNLITAIGAAIP